MTRRGARKKIENAVETRLYNALENRARRIHTRARKLGPCNWKTKYASTWEGCRGMSGY